MIAIIDYNCGNILSVKNIIKKAGHKSILTNNPLEISKADKIILPGVGAFDYGMNKLKEYNLIDPIIQHVKSKKPMLGICLGMQLMTKSSEEGNSNGLSIVDAEVVKFKSVNKFPVPHMGWNSIKIQKDSPIFTEDKFYKFYFVHSYYVKCNVKSDVLTTTTYSEKFVSSFQSGNIFGVQFHPEKSHKYGLELMNNFLML